MAKELGFHKMRVITYFTPDMSIAAGKLIDSAHRFGMSARGYTDVDPTYRLMNSVFNEHRGAGYWLWKPYIIFREMMHMSDGEYLMYCDAGVELLAEPVFQTDDVWLYGNMYQHEHWCKADTMNMIYPGPYGKQVQASVIIVNVNGHSKNIIKEWLTWCEMPGLLDDCPSKTKNRKGFQEHRHDQAVLTCVAYKYGIPLHWWPASYNNGQFTYPREGYSDTYGVQYNHHRKRNHEW